MEILKPLSINSPRECVKRQLFGPVNHDDNMRFLHKHLTLAEEQDKKYWNFDFRMEKPVKDSNGRYLWEEVNCSDFIPIAYALNRLPFCGRNRPTKTARNESGNLNVATPTSTGKTTAPRAMKYLGQQNGGRTEVSVLPEGLKLKSPTSEETENIPSESLERCGPFMEKTPEQQVISGRQNPRMKQSMITAYMKASKRAEMKRPSVQQRTSEKRFRPITS